MRLSEMAGRPNGALTILSVALVFAIVAHTCAAEKRLGALSHCEGFVLGR